MSTNKETPPPDRIWLYKDRSQAVPTNWMPFWSDRQNDESDLPYARVSADGPGSEAKCAHCSQPFAGKRSDAMLCPPCFIAGHRGFVCSKYCVVTTEGEAIAHQYRNDYAVNPELSPHGRATTPSLPAISDAELGEIETLAQDAKLYLQQLAERNPIEVPDPIFEINKAVKSIPKLIAAIRASSPAPDKGDVARRIYARIERFVDWEAVAMAFASDGKTTPEFITGLIEDEFKG